jgi:hypothetical protein
VPPKQGTWRQVASFVDHARSLQTSCSQPWIPIMPSSHLPYHSFNWHFLGNYLYNLYHLCILLWTYGFLPICLMCFSLVLFNVICTYSPLSVLSRYRHPETFMQQPNTDDCL